MSDLYREPTENEPEAVGETREMPAAPETKEQPAASERPASAQEQALSSPPAGGPTPVSVPSPSAAPPVQAPIGVDMEKDRQLKMLVDLAFSGGIDKAVEAVNATGEAYLIDKFHDTLVDELHQQLVEKGKLKEI